MFFDFFSSQQSTVKKDTKHFTNIIEKPREAYVVLHRMTNSPLGVFDSLQEAKDKGCEATHHNCMIIPFIINNDCKYLNSPIYEDK
jgi:hypothetical protein